MMSITVTKTVHWSWLTVSDLLALPTLAVGQADDLKYDDGKHRVWLSRTRPADWDGKSGFKRVSYEVLRDGRWVPCEAGDASS